MSRAVATAGVVVVRATGRGRGSAGPGADVQQPPMGDEHAQEGRAPSEHGGGPGPEEREGGSKGLRGRLSRLGPSRLRGNRLTGVRLRRTVALLGLVAGLLVLVGVIAVLTVDDDGGDTALPSTLLGEDPVESENLASASELVREPLTEAGLEDVQTRFYGSSADSPAVFLARGAVPEDAENARTVLDRVQNGLVEVYESGTLSAARPPGGDGIRCAGTNLPDAGQSTLCAFEQDGSIAAFTLFGVAPDTAQTMVLRVRDEVVGTS